MLKEKVAEIVEKAERQNQNIKVVLKPELSLDELDAVVALLTENRIEIDDPNLEALTNLTVRNREKIKGTPIVFLLIHGLSPQLRTAVVSGLSSAIERFEPGITQTLEKGWSE